MSACAGNGLSGWAIAGLVVLGSTTIFVIVAIMIRNAFGLGQKRYCCYCKYHRDDDTCSKWIIQREDTAQAPIFTYGQCSVKNAKNDCHDYRLEVAGYD